MSLLNRTLISFFIAASLVSCYPSRELFYLPSASDTDFQLEHRDCCGGVGAEETIVIRGPKGVTLYLAIWRGDVGIPGMVIPYKNKSLFGELALYIPKDVSVYFHSDTIKLINPSTGLENEFKIHKVRDYPVHKKYCSSLLSLARMNYENEANTHDLKPFISTHMGTGDKGSYVYVDIHAEDSFGDPDKVLAQLPPMTVGNEKFAPGLINFIWTEREYVYPFNC